MAESNSLDMLPMFPMKQAAIIGHMLQDSSFFFQGIHKIQSDWFRDIYHQKIYRVLVSLHKAINRQPTVEELKNWKDLLKEDLAIRNKIFIELNNCLDACVRIKLDTIKPELTEWLHSKILQEAMLKGSKHWNTGRYDLSAQLLTEAVRNYHEAKFEEGESIDFLNFNQYLKDVETDRANALTTGLTLLDKALLENSTGGGLQLGDTTVILAPTNVGKTSTLITIAVHNIMHGKNVLFMTHEGPPPDIRLKLLKCVLQMDEAELFALYKTPEGQNLLGNATKLLNRRLKYVPYNKAGMNVEDVLPIIRREQEKWRGEHDGSGFHLLVSDYPGKLSTVLAGKGNMPPRLSIEYVYNIYIQLALEYRWHSLLSYQTNREASKENKGKNSDDYGENRLLQVEDAGEAYGPMKDATNVISLNRSPRAIQQNQMTFYVGKSRSNKTGIAVVAKTKFSAALTHSDELGAIAYEGTRTKDHAIDELLKTYKGQIVPSEIADSNH